MTANADIVATVGSNPWWVGTGAQEGAQHIAMGDENVTSEEMLVRGKQDWEVELSPLVTTYRDMSGLGGLRRTVEVPNRRAVVRTDTGAVLGIVSNRYEAVQNRDAFRFFDSVVGEGQAIYHTAGSLGAAERLAQIPTTPMEIEGVLQRIFPLPTQLLLTAPAPTLLLPEPKREDIAPEFNIIFKKRDIVRTLINQGVGNTGETRWDVLNGVSEYTDYFQGHTRLRAQSLLFGNGQQMKQQTLDLLKKGITG